MGYLLNCDCGREHTVQTSQAGQEIACQCGQTVKVPTLRSLTTLPPAEPEKSSRKNVVDSQGIWQGWRGPAIAMCSAACLVAGAFASWFLLQRALIDTSYNADEEIARSNLVFDEYSPEELSLVWNSYEELGLGPKVRPEFYAWNSYAKAREYLALINGSISGFFGLAALCIWFSARRRPPSS
ncbi:MAG: hypothetical protein KDB22_04065 [Planctomycetales bacterium]|nr:hypothetical protein [Planctomycetales bacterium]